MTRLFIDELDDPRGDQPYEESPGIFICRRCAAEIYHYDSLCRHCKRIDTFQRRRQQRQQHQPEEPDDE